MDCKLMTEFMPIRGLKKILLYSVCSISVNKNTIKPPIYKYSTVHTDLTKTSQLTHKTHKADDSYFQIQDITD